MLNGEKVAALRRKVTSCPERCGPAREVSISCTDLQALLDANEALVGVRRELSRVLAENQRLTESR